MIIPPVAVPTSAPGSSADGADGTDPGTADAFAALVAGFLVPTVMTDPVVVDGQIAAPAASGAQPIATAAATPSVTIDPAAVQGGSFVPLTAIDAPDLPAAAPLTAAPADLTAAAPAIAVAPQATIETPVATVTIAPTGKDTQVAAAVEPGVTPVAAPTTTADASSAAAAVGASAPTVAKGPEPEKAADAPRAPEEGEADTISGTPFASKPESSSIETVPEPVATSTATAAAPQEASAAEATATQVAPVVEDVDTAADDDVAPIPTIDHAAAPIRTEAPVSVAHAEAPAPTADVQPHQQIVSVVAPLRHHADGSYRLNLHLRPAELGPVNLEVELHHGVVELHMHAEHDHARELLVEHLGDLRRELKEAGLNPGNLDVAGGNQSRGQFGSQTAPSSSSAPALGADVPAVAPLPTSPSVSISGSTGLDARL